MKVLITGGSGFVGSSLAFKLRSEFPNAEIVIFDNLKRRGSEMNLAKFQHKQIRFVHGDIRNANDFDDLRSETFDLMIEASAEPSVHAGTNGSPHYLIQTNLFGTVNCLEFARTQVGFLTFLSTSRVYSLLPLQNLRYSKSESRFELDSRQDVVGVGPQGIAENFPVDTARSLYGTTKLASEYLLQEYINNFGLKAVMNRCGVLVGPGQFGKVDQGVFTLWMANHYFKKKLKYTGYDGSGRQVRDLLHPDDLYNLLMMQFANQEKSNGQTYNVGGGRDISTSLLELTRICQEFTGNSIEITSDPKTAAMDIPIYLTDSRRVQQDYNWSPKKNVQTIMSEIYKWLQDNEMLLRTIF